MKAITLTQPFATLISIGAKKWETRDWKTDYRGPLAIHAAKGFPDWAQELCYEEPFRSHLAAAGYQLAEELPRGVIVATCQIVACPTTEDVLADPRNRLSPRQRSFGNWRAGRFAWKLEDIMAVLPPVEARGQLGLWDFDEIAAGVEVLVTARLF